MKDWLNKLIENNNFSAENIKDIFERSKITGFFSIFKIYDYAVTVNTDISNLIIKTVGEIFNEMEYTEKINAINITKELARNYQMLDITEDFLDEVDKYIKEN